MTPAHAAGSPHGVPPQAAQVVRPPVPVRLRAVFAAWQRARRGKKPSQNQLRFEARWLSQLQKLTTTLRAGAWQPTATVAFVVRHPKTREIHAPDFADRVVHHLLVERLEKLFEPRFIHDSFANRSGKGSHAAVQRLQTFLRQRENMPQQQPACGWYVQLDIHNFFNTLHRPTLYGLLCHRLAQAQQRGELPDSHAQALRGLCHALLARKVEQHERDPAAAASLPLHKRLCNAPPGRGVPVGHPKSHAPPSPQPLSHKGRGASKTLHLPLPLRERVGERGKLHSSKKGATPSLSAASLAHVHSASGCGLNFRGWPKVLSCCPMAV